MRLTTLLILVVALLMAACAPEPYSGEYPSAQQGPITLAAPTETLTPTPFPTHTPIWSGRHPSELGDGSMILHLTHGYPVFTSQGDSYHCSESRSDFSGDAFGVSVTALGIAGGGTSGSSRDVRCIALALPDAPQYVVTAEGAVYLATPAAYPFLQET
jgi:hypothetical protein